jgi:wyosine [tRNA(Phe)-imidazoG37] synthetase (radical SAM superfamily)
MEMKYVFGPVPSRRLGNSLGINPIPLKTCNYSCVYCQLGRTDFLRNERKEYIPLENIKKELDYFFKSTENPPDYITIVGEGEPLLYSKTGELNDYIKKNFSSPLAFITNGSLLYFKEVREEIMNTDVLLPTVDTVFSDTFIKINRPHKGLELKNILQGLLDTRKDYRGEFWVEVMMVKGLNDSEKEIKGLSEYFNKLKPDKIFINVSVRPPAEKWVEPPPVESFHLIEKYIPSAEFINFSEAGKIDPSAYNSLEELIISISRRHPISMELLKKSVIIDEKSIENSVKSLETQKKIKLIEHSGKIFIRGLR